MRDKKLVKDRTSISFLLEFILNFVVQEMIYEFRNRILFL